MFLLESLDNKYSFYSNGCASSSKNFRIYILFISMDVASSNKSPMSPIDILSIMDLNVLFWTQYIYIWNAMLKRVTKTQIIKL
jgi:hypothetical protein